MSDPTTIEPCETEAATVAAELKTALTMAEAAKELRRSLQSMYLDAAQSRLRVLRIGHKMFVPKAELFRILLAARG